MSLYTSVDISKSKSSTCLIVHHVEVERIASEHVGLTHAEHLNTRKATLRGISVDNDVSTKL